MSGEPLGEARIDIVADTSKLDAGIKDAHARAATGAADSSVNKELKESGHQLKEATAGWHLLIAALSRVVLIGTAVAGVLHGIAEWLDRTRQKASESAHELNVFQDRLEDLSKKAHESAFAAPSIDDAAKSLDGLHEKYKKLHQEVHANKSMNLSDILIADNRLYEQEENERRELNERMGALAAESRTKLAHERLAERRQETEEAKRLDADVAHERLRGLQQLDADETEELRKLRDKRNSTTDPGRQAQIDKESDATRERLRVRRSEALKADYEELYQLQRRHEVAELSGAARINQERKNAIADLLTSREHLLDPFEKAITDSMVKALNKSFDIALARFALQLQMELNKIGDAARGYLGGDNLVSSIDNLADIVRLNSRNRSPLD